jgi:hypothetical protein
MMQQKTGFCRFFVAVFSPLRSLLVTLSTSSEVKAAELVSFLSNPPSSG